MEIKAAGFAIESHRSLDTIILIKLKNKQ